MTQQDKDVWSVDSVDLDDLTPARVRDVIVDCFFFAQKETLKRGMASANPEKADMSDEQLKTVVVGSVRLAFSQAGGDFDSPEVSRCLEAVEILARKARAWGTPKDIIEHHSNEIGKVFAKLLGQPGIGAD